MSQTKAQSVSRIVSLEIFDFFLCQSTARGNDDGFLFFLRFHLPHLLVVLSENIILLKKNFVNCFLFFERTFSVDLLLFLCYYIIRKRGENMTQGERLKNVRKSLGLTLESFGEKLGVKKNSLSQIENGRNSLTEQMAKSICREFHVNYDYLLYGDGEMFDDLPQTVLDELCVQYGLDDLDRSLVEMYLEMPDAVREGLKQEIRKWISKGEK